MKRKVDKLDIIKLKTALVDLSKLSNVEKKNDVVKMTKKVNAIQTTDTSNLV